VCQFKSAIVLKDEKCKGGFRLLMSPWSESHSELCTIFNLNDTAKARLYFARVEFTPPSLDDAHLPEKYTLRIDEYRTPEWFDDEMKEGVAEQMRDYIKRIVVTGDVQLLIGGQFIIAPSAKVECAHSMVINVCGGTINAVWGGTINAVWGGTINAVWGGTINAVWGGTINDVCGGTINAVWGGTINDVRGGTINDVRGGTINAVWGGTINAVRGGTINAVWGGTINAVAEFFTGLIGRVHPGATIVKDNRPKSEPQKSAKGAKAK
jgi:hypothetical protein